MTTATKHVLPRLVLLGLLLLAYFVVYPEDLAGVLSPVATGLGLSSAISPWLYALIAVAILCWTALRIWGRATIASREAPPLP
jgi:hypothetical protein